MDSKAHDEQITISHMSVLQFSEMILFNFHGAFSIVSFFGVGVVGSRDRPVDKLG